MDQNIPHPAPSDCAAAAPTPRESDAAALARQLDMLHDLSVLGMDFCNGLHARREKPGTPGTSTTRQETAEARATAQAFGSLARTVRHTISLEASLRENHRRRAVAATAAAAAAAKTRLEDGKRELRHRMQPVLQAAPAKSFSDVRYRISDSFDDWDTEQDLAHRSVDHAIRRICHHFAVAPPPHARSP